jgi:hypothetical protein
VAYSDSEPLVSDARLEVIADALRAYYPGQLGETTFVTALVTPPEGHPPEAHFLMFTPDPRQSPLALAPESWGTLMRMSHRAWLDDEAKRSRFVQGTDTATLMFAAVAKQHLMELANRREMSAYPIETYQRD